jgi:hypothetical protein
MRHLHKALIRKLAMNQRLRFKMSYCGPLVDVRSAIDNGEIVHSRKHFMDLRGK